MEEFIKNLLYYIALGSGSIALICLFVAGTIRTICILIDHLKVGNIMRKALMLYIKTVRPSMSLKEEDINISKSRIERNRR